ncbi:MAG: TetR family transcriptional regulator C-terminal domain-containing protein, partial [Candidatus Thiodiazotropha sp.]
KQIIQTGCPLNNLAQEMSTVDEGFRKRIDKIYSLWRSSIADALTKGQSKGFVREDIESDKVATFIVASIAGCLGAGKNSRDINVLKDCGHSLINYLDSLRC